MKDKLTNEQSLRLFELGISEDKASAIDEETGQRQFTLANIIEVLTALTAIGEYKLRMDIVGGFYNVYLFHNLFREKKAEIRSETEMIDAVFGVAVCILEKLHDDFKNKINGTKE